MKCKISKYSWLLPKNAGPLTAKQLEAFRSMSTERQSKYMGFRAYLDANDNSALNNIAVIKNRQFANQSQKGWTKRRIEADAVKRSEQITEDIRSSGGTDIADVGMHLLQNRVRGDVFNVAEKEIVAKTFLNRMNGLDFLTDQIDRAIARGDESALKLLSIEMNKTTGAIAAYLGDINATSVAFSHIKKLNADIAKGRELAKLFPDGGC